jgi:hypothetical protein
LGENNRLSALIFDTRIRKDFIPKKICWSYSSFFDNSTSKQQCPTLFLLSHQWRRSGQDTVFVLDFADLMGDLPAEIACPILGPVLKPLQRLLLKVWLMLGEKVGLRIKRILEPEVKCNSPLNLHHLNAFLRNWGLHGGHNLGLDGSIRRPKGGGSAYTGSRSVCVSAL